MIAFFAGDHRAFDYENDQATILPVHWVTLNLSKNASAYPKSDTSLWQVLNGQTTILDSGSSYWAVKSATSEGDASWAQLEVDAGG